jgi:predicted aldo/keto reductase-like oxidoreductase
LIKVEFDIENFNQDIQRMLDSGVGYVEAIIEYCDKNQIEIEVMASIIKKSPQNKEKLLLDATKNRLLKKAI